MKFLSVFTKAPKHQRFNYSPRFYDPTKEELEQRESRIKLEIAREKGSVNPDDFKGYRGRISGAFQAARKRSNPVSAGTNATMLRLGILLFITALLVAFLEFGKPALYSLFLFVPFYLYLKFKSK
ncbi:MAG: hypothetical protein RI909_1563 [Bacteroidota bacterium]|jgi:hypothetical protein